MSILLKIPFKGLLGTILKSRFTGWGFFALVTLVMGLWVKYDNMSDDLAKCQAAKPNKATLEFVEELKDIDNEKLKAALAELDDTDHPCLGWVYDPAPEVTTGTVQPTGEGE